MNCRMELPPNFNWVKARADCSLALVFKELEEGAKLDCETANGIRSDEDLHQFSISIKDGGFSVIRLSKIALPLSVEFYLKTEGIEIGSNGKVNIVATITLNNEGQCKLKVSGIEMDHWQVRRMALEDLLFGGGGSPMPRASR